MKIQHDVIDLLLSIIVYRSLLHLIGKWQMLSLNMFNCLSTSMIYILSILDLYVTGNVI